MVFMVFMVFGVFRVFRVFSVGFLGLVFGVFRAFGVSSVGFLGLVFGVFRAFGVFGVFKVNDILEGQKGDKGGGPKMAKIQYGVKPDIFKRAAQKWPKFWVG